MYAEFFGFRELPFSNTPDPRFFFPTPDHEEALASLVYAVTERKGFVLLTGEVGAGKTLMTRMMLRRLGERVAFANIHHGVSSPRELMECICAEFELPVEPGTGTRQLVRALHDFLLAKFAQDVPVVLVLDEAQNIPLGAFEQLRMIGNLESDQAKLLQVAIVGQTELQELFLSPELRQLRQRVFRAFHLPALGEQDTGRYIRHRLAAVMDSPSEIFDQEAMDAVYQFSRGLPRVINTLCDNALLSAYAADRRRIDGPFLQSVIEQMMIMGPGDEGIANAECRMKNEGRGSAGRTVLTAHRTRTVRGADPTDFRPSTFNLGPSTLQEAKPSHVPVPDGSLAPLYQRTGWLTEKQSQLAGLLHRLHARNSDLSQQVAGLEHRLADRSADLGDARVLHARLQPMLEQARTAVTRAQSVSRQLDSQETRLRTLATTIKTSVHQLQKLLDTAHQVTDRKRTSQPTGSVSERMTSSEWRMANRDWRMLPDASQSRCPSEAENGSDTNATPDSPTSRLAQQVDALLAMTTSTP